MIGFIVGCFFFLSFRYNKLSRNIRELAQKIRDLDEKDGFRAQSTHRFLEKLWVARGRWVGTETAQKQNQ